MGVTAASGGAPWRAYTSDSRARSRVSPGNQLDMIRAGRRVAHAVARQVHLMRFLPRRDCELDPAGIDALGGPSPGLFNALD